MTFLVKWRKNPFSYFVKLQHKHSREDFSLYVKRKNESQTG